MQAIFNLKFSHINFHIYTASFTYLYKLASPLNDYEIMFWMIRNNWHYCWCYKAQTPKAISWCVYTVMAPSYNKTIIIANFKNWYNSWKYRTKIHNCKGIPIQYINPVHLMAYTLLPIWRGRLYWPSECGHHTMPPNCKKCTHKLHVLRQIILTVWAINRQQMLLKVSKQIP